MPRPRFQYRLSSLFILTAVVAVGCLVGPPAWSWAKATFFPSEESEVWEDVGGPGTIKEYRNVIWCSFGDGEGQSRTPHRKLHNRATDWRLWLSRATSGPKGRHDRRSRSPDTAPARQKRIVGGGQKQGQNGCMTKSSDAKQALWAPGCSRATHPCRSTCRRRSGCRPR